MRRTARHTFATVTIAALLFACSGDPEPEPLDLSVANGAENSTDDADGDDDGEGGEVAVELPEPAYPELPPFEPDPDSDVPEDEQREVFETYAQAYDAMQRSLATAQADPRLEQHVDGQALEEIRDAVEEMAAQGIVSRSPDSRVLWVRIIESTESSARTEACHVLGGQSGDYSMSTGAPVELLDVDERQLLYTADIVRAGSESHVVSVGAEEPVSPCEELLP
ncbi:hypothetical protein FTX61_22140 [Nitriliruptoraceae bacterium ZYF776]|nr:hypothetical protein [Profundirhabdus halotolerans]